ncbi:MAG: hypothetical protein RR296_05445 [Clostridia bacterium]
MKKTFKKLWMLTLIVAVLTMPFAALAAEATYGWTQFDAVWFFVDTDGTLMTSDPYAFTLPPEGAVIGELPSETPPAELEQNVPQDEVIQDIEIGQPEAEPEAEPEVEPEADVDDEMAVQPDDAQAEIIAEDESGIETLPAQDETPIAPEGEVEDAPEDTEVISEIDDAGVETLPAEDGAVPVAPESNMAVSVLVSYEGDAPHYGSAITLLSTVTDAPDGARLAYQWQTKTPDSDWSNVEGATDATYGYVLSEDNAANTYRLIVTPNVEG